MVEILGELGVSPFELAVGTIVLLVVSVTWYVNRFRAESGHEIRLSTELITALVTLAGILTIMVLRSELASSNPVALVAFASSALMIIIGLYGVHLSRQTSVRVDDLSTQIGNQVAGLGNLQFFPSKEVTFNQLIEQTARARDKLIATRFSPADISTESDYWLAIKQRALDPSLLYIRIHSLAHHSPTCIDGICRLIDEFRGASQFRLGIAAYNNSFELILSDEQQCIVCFHDLEMTIRNGFRIDANMPSSAKVVANFEDTLRHMLASCYLVIDFGRHVQTLEQAECIKRHLRQVHAGYREGRIPHSIHARDVDDYLEHLFASDSGA